MLLLIAIAKVLVALGLFSGEIAQVALINIVRAYDSTPHRGGCT